MERGKKAWGHWPIVWGQEELYFFPQPPWLCTGALCSCIGPVLRTTSKLASQRPGSIRDPANGTGRTQEEILELGLRGYRETGEI